MKLLKLFLFTVVLSLPYLISKFFNNQHNLTNNCMKYDFTIKDCFFQVNSVLNTNFFNYKLIYFFCDPSPT